MFQFTSQPKPLRDGYNSHSIDTSIIGTAKFEKRQITRNRASYSCATCRRRKVKCDKIHPVCGGCEKAGEECVYASTESHVKTLPGSQSKESEGGDVKKRKMNSTRQATELISAPSDAPQERPAASTQIETIEAQLQRLTALVETLKRESHHSSAHFHDRLTPVSSQPSSSEPDLEDSHTSTKLGLNTFQRDLTGLSKPLSTLALHNEGLSMAEDACWDHLSDEVHELNQMMHRQNNTYVVAGSIQNRKCPTMATETLAAAEVQSCGKDDLFEPDSFHKAANITSYMSHDLDASCNHCRRLPFTKSTLLQDIPIRSLPTTARQHLMSHIPTQTQSNVLLRSWLANVYPLLPVLIPAELIPIHENFWDRVSSDPNDNSNYPDLSAAALMYAVWYAGVLSVSEAGLKEWFPDTTRAELSASFHDMVVLALHLSSFSRNTNLQTLASYIIICSIPAAEEDPVQSSLYMQLLVRLSLSMGLHREPSLFNLSPTEEGLRRRLWWQVIQLDISQVVASGYPSLISDAFCDTRICEDQETKTTESSASNSSTSSNKSAESDEARQSSTKHSEMHRTFSLVARGKSILSCAMRIVASMHMVTRPLNNDDMQEIKKIIYTSRDQVDSILNQIPTKGLPETGFIPTEADQPSNRTRDDDAFMALPVGEDEISYYTNKITPRTGSSPFTDYHRQKLAAFNKWARITLSMSTDKLTCVAFVPFLKNTKSKLWGAARQCALRVCHGFLRKLISLVQDPDLEHLRWSWPASYGPMHAAMILLVDLYERPYSIEAARSRGLLDQLFSYSDPERGIVGGPNGVTVQRPLREGGVQAWDMLRGLRSAAWQKVGLEPRVLWTEADQIEIGLAQPLTETQRIFQCVREDSFYVSEQLECPVETAEFGKGYNRSQVEASHHVYDHPGPDEPENFDTDGHTSSRAQRNHFLQQIENNQRLNPKRGLAWLPSQQKMPYPLSGHLEQCSGEHLTETASAHLMQFNEHIPRERTAGSSQHPVCRPNTDVPGLQSLREHDNLDLESPNQVIDFIDEHNRSRKQDIDQPILENGNSVHDTPAKADSAPTSDAALLDLGFDWERWDSVFGQYAGFTDLMEDVQWNE